MEWTSNPNDGYYWTSVKGHKLKQEIVRVSRGRYSCASSGWMRSVDGSQLFFGPLPEPPARYPFDFTSENDPPDFNDPRQHPMSPRREKPEPPTQVTPPTSVGHQLIVEAESDPQTLATLRSLDEIDRIRRKPLPAENCRHPECPLCDGIEVVCKHQPPAEPDSDDMSACGHEWHDDR